MREICEKARKVRILLQKKPKNSKKPLPTTPVAVKKSKPLPQNYLTYEEGKVIKPLKINVENLPKFFKKGMELNRGNDKILIEKSELSLIATELK